MEAAGNNEGTLLAILIIGVIILIVSVRLGLLARLLTIFKSQPVMPGTEQNNLTPAHMTPVDNISASGRHKVNINGDFAADDSGDSCVTDLAASIRAEKTSGVNIVGGAIFVGGDIVAGDKFITMDLTKSLPITCPACGRGYVPVESQYACPNCGTATPQILVQST